MKTTVSGSITHLCPHVDEVDVGTVMFTFDGPAPELHDLARYVETFHSIAVTHEELTQRLADHYPDADVVTVWTTAGFEVVVRVP